MVNVDDLSGFTKVLLTQIVPFLGCVLALTVFSAPMIAVLRARRTGRLGEINPVPYPCMVGNTIAWISYGCATKDQYVFWANFPGLFLGGFYCMSAYALAYKREYEARTSARAITAKSVDMIMASTPVAKDDPVSQSAALAQAQGPMGGQPEARETAPTSGAVSVSTPRRSMKERFQSQLFRMELLLVFAILVNGAVIYTSCFYLDLDTAQTVLGATGNFMVTFLYISPLATMVKVIRTRNAESIDPYFGAGQILNCILWSVYGLVLNDPLIYVVNIFGLLTGIVQYILLIMYWPGRTKKGAPGDSATGPPSGDASAVAMETGSADGSPRAPTKGKLEPSPDMDNVVDVS